MSRPDPLLHTRVAGRYLVEEKLGGGGMGAVYVAVQEPLGRRVALKVVKRALTDDPTAVERFVQEARLLARLTHPNIVTIYDFGTLDGSAPGEHAGAGLFIAMELLAGRDLGVELGRGRPPWREAVRIAREVARALDVAHRANVVHRDLKPANVMLIGDGPEPQVKVVDFGVAKLAGDGAGGLTDTGLVVGTPGYIAPEQLHGVRDDPRSDLYALGVVLFEALTGRAPFVAETPMKLVLRHMTDPAPTVTDVVSAAGFPPALEHVVSSLLEKEPGRRPSTADELGLRLDEILAASHAAAFPGPRAVHDLPPSNSTEPAFPTPLPRPSTPVDASASSGVGAPLPPSGERPAATSPASATPPPAALGGASSSSSSTDTAPTGVAVTAPMSAPRGRWTVWRLLLAFALGGGALVVGVCGIVVAKIARDVREVASTMTVIDGGLTSSRGPFDITVKNDTVTLGNILRIDNTGIVALDAGAPEEARPPASSVDEARASVGRARRAARAARTAVAAPPTPTAPSAVVAAPTPPTGSPAEAAHAQRRGLRQALQSALEQRGPPGRHLMVGAVEMYAQVLGRDVVEDTIDALEDAADDELDAERITDREHKRRTDRLAEARAVLDELPAEAK